VSLFKVFKIKYGDVLEELGDRLGAALLYLSATNQKIDAGFKMLGEKQDMMLEKQDATIEAIGEVSEKKNPFKSFFGKAFFSKERTCTKTFLFKKVQK